MDFEWDRDKASLNLKKHRVSFEEAVTIFYDSLATSFPDRPIQQMKPASLPMVIRRGIDCSLSRMPNEVKLYALLVRG